MHTVKLYMICFIFILVIDAFWLGLVAKNTYVSYISPVMKPFTISSIPFAVLTYLLLTIAIVFLALPRAVSFSGALGYGMLLGLIIYGIYDFTNYAIVANWSFTFSIIDIIWGVILCGITTVFAFWVKTVSI